MNIRQAVKMAWKSIIGKKGRSILTMLGVIIGIAAVMTIVSVMSGYAAKTMEQFNAMGSNKVTVQISTWGYYEVDENGNAVSQGKDYFPDLYDYCKSIPEYVIGVSPEAYASVNVVYGTKNSENFQWDWDENGNMTGQYPPQVYYVSDQYSICNNLIVSKGRDLSELDIERYNQVCVMGSQAAKVFFDAADPVGKFLQLNGQSFQVAGVYAPRLEDENAQGSTIDNFIVLPYTARRLLGGENITSFTVKAQEGKSSEAATRIRGYLKGIVDQNTGDVYVAADDRWQQSMNEQMGMISLVLGGIAAISLLVGGIGIMNIMLVTVTERTREIGIRRAIGAQRSSIVTQFLIEAAMLCGIGGIIGILIGTLGCYVAGNLLFHMTIYPSVTVTAGAFGFSILLGLIFGSYPAIKASKLQPVEALRAD